MAFSAYTPQKRGAWERLDLRTYNIDGHGDDSRKKLHLQIMSDLPRIKTAADTIFII